MFTPILSNMHPQLQTNRNYDYEVTPPMWQHKGALINDISIIQDSLGKGPVDCDQFEALWKMSNDELTRIVNDQASQLDRARALLRF